MLAVGALLTACGGSPPPISTPVPVAADTVQVVVAYDTLEAARARTAPPRAVVPTGPAVQRFVYFGTDRAPTGDTTAHARYGAGQGDLQTGVARVSLPTDRTRRPTGELPPIPMLGRFRRAPDPSRDIFLERTIPLDAPLWLEQVRRQVALDPRRAVLIYVHGFANSFEDAVRRGAQLAYDLPFDGAMLVYSWPSRGEADPVAYFRDDKTIAGSQAPLRAFLETVIEQTGAERVHLLAHSMGALLVSRTLKEMADQYPGTRFDQVVLAAPDIDTTAFRRTFAPALQKIAQRVTVYASRYDKALDLAQAASTYPRVGQAGASLLVLPGLDIIDASSAGPTEFGHGYFSGSNAVLADLRELLLDRPPASRRLQPRQRGTLTFWELLGGPR
jgi:esterase/lipase superfamily enzyme